MSTQTATPELRLWILEQARAGHAPDAVLQAMRQSGWEEEVALAALEQTLEGFLAEHARQQALPSATPVPEPDLARSPAVVCLPDGQVVRVVVSMRDPRVVVFADFLSRAECEALRQLAAPRLARSETVDNSTGGSEVNAARTSAGMFFGRGETALIERIEQRIAALLRWPIENGEGLQVLHYLPGAEYKPHYDYFDPAQPGSATILKRGGQRVGTLVMYLNTPEAGGGTTFPDVQLDVAPVQGHAVFFSYDRAHPSSRSLHGGAPVIAGEKWVATKWLRERRFD
ncbi:2OG-Fe(II) oxygenase [Sphaerotilus sp.]|uniref:2OG-Fe(II) oxygenase n=1 Tax=Sphaerotilus sp. TaxID=2093942 RepID=UPI002ACD68B8|nr:2OG-Fe(II) oxygenase [Sphaerotilus sp.]MDZ7856224.1 2OG-Fe(II) oxygenase [Sphaerotilus sp.]